MKPRYTLARWAHTERFRGGDAAASLKRAEELEYMRAALQRFRGGDAAASLKLDGVRVGVAFDGDSAAEMPRPHGSPLGDSQVTTFLHDSAAEMPRPHGSLNTFLRYHLNVWTIPRLRCRGLIEARDITRVRDDVGADSAAEMPRPHGSRSRRPADRRRRSGFRGGDAAASLKPVTTTGGQAQAIVIPRLRCRGLIEAL